MCVHALIHNLRSQLKRSWAKICSWLKCERVKTRDRHHTKYRQCKWALRDRQVIPDSLYSARLQGITVVVFINLCARLSNDMHIAESRARFDEYNYRDSLQARAIEGIGYCFTYAVPMVLVKCWKVAHWNAKKLQKKLPKI